MSEFRVIEGDCVASLRTLPDESVQTCITSPPYWGLRDYGNVDQIGLEESPGLYVATLVGVFREVRRVLRDDGTLWLNLGDSFGSGKQLMGIPWRVAFALQSDGWILRSDIIWSKPNPMPESVTDRPTKAHEYLFLLTKSPRYFYDAGAIREEGTSFGRQRSLRTDRIERAAEVIDRRWQGPAEDRYDIPGRNKRSVWEVATQPFPGAHFATFPPKLIEPCILAGSADGDSILDPFNGAGTTGLVALRHNRNYIGIELNPEYAQMARDRLYDDAPMLNVEAA